MLMPNRTLLLPLWVATAWLAGSPGAQGPTESPDLAMYRRIRDEGATRSQVMRYASELMDGVGPRLTGSPNLARAATWAIDTLRAAGATNARRESWGEFGMGWQQRNVWARLVEPDAHNFVAAAAPWSPPTRGTVSGPVVRVPGFGDESGFAPLRGKLRGAIVLLGRSGGIPETPPIDKPLFERLDAAQLAELAKDPAEPDADDGPLLERVFADGEFAERMSRFFADEGVLAVMVPSGNNPSGGISGGTLHVDFNYNLGRYAHLKARAMRVPLLVIAVEEYLRMERLLGRGVPVRVEANVDVEFTGDGVEGFNVLAEIPGTDTRRRDEVVLTTAHLDSWAVGTGATDDGAGVVIAMEALRILGAVGVRPDRTIKIALWTGHEQGLIGSSAYVARHVAEVPRAASPEQMRVPLAFRRRLGPFTPKADYPRISAVYNVDLGAGKIRGVGVGGNRALVPIFQQWLAPLADLGATLVTLRPRCPGDCRPFAEIGIPTPGVWQDPLEYDTRTHHTTSDTFDRLVPDDLRQASIVLATLLYNTAMRDEMLPRAP